VDAINIAITMANENCFGKTTYGTPASFSTVPAELVGSTTPRSSSVAVAAAVVFVSSSTSTGDGHRREMCSNGSLSACTSVKLLPFLTPHPVTLEAPDLLEQRDAGATHF
jgi:hypothetical protein